MRAVITGGAGFIGSNLANFLLQKGFSVCVIDDFSIGKKNNLLKNEKRLEIIRADITKYKNIVNCFNDNDIVFHMAVQCVRKSFQNPLLVHEVNTTGTLNILEAARRKKIKRFIYVSSSEVYGTAIKGVMNEQHALRPTTIYGASKLAGEYYALSYLTSYNLPVIVARPFNTYGYNAHFEGESGEVIPRFVLRCLNNLPIQIFGDGNQTRDFTFISDTINGLWMVADKGNIGQIYNIARGKEISILHLADLITKITGNKVTIEHLSARQADVRRHFADVSRAKKEFGFQAKIDIEEGLTKYIQWFKKKHPKSSKLLNLYEEKNW